MTKIINFCFYCFSLFFLLTTNSFSQPNYKTNLLNYPWSANCNDIKSPVIIFTEGSNNEVIKNAFVESKTVDAYYQSIKKVEVTNEGLLHITFIDFKNRSGSDTIELKEGSYRLINRIIDA